MNLAVNDKGQTLVDNFTYNSSAHFRTVHIGDEVTANTAKACIVLSRLRGNVLWLKRNRP